MIEILAFIEKLKPIIELLTALIPIFIAALGSYIAIQQYRTNRMKLKNDLFEKRYAVFETVNSYITEVAKGKSVDINQREEFQSGTKGVEFLFDDKMKAYITEIWKQAEDLQAWEEDEIPSTYSEERALHRKWFAKQRTDINVKFKDYMHLSH
jgi:uncharacterized membrane protein